MLIRRISVRYDGVMLYLLRSRAEAERRRNCAEKQRARQA